MAMAKGALVSPRGRGQLAQAWAGKRLLQNSSRATQQRFQQSGCRQAEVFADGKGEGGRRRRMGNAGASKVV
ncbi:hypothetical protein AZSI13_33970 [Azospira sp. I13]|nr:hypothetical protein AZSI13_33970 [Azospira sp. I13]